MDFQRDKKVLTRGKIECGVPQCKTYRKPGISMHMIPKDVLNSKAQKAKWMIALKMGKDFPKNFKICSLHFEKEEVFTPTRRDGVHIRASLRNSAFPTKNLPVSSIIKNKKNDSDRSNRLQNRKSAIYSMSSKESSELPVDSCLFRYDVIEPIRYNSVAVQCEIKVTNKGTQAYFGMPVYITSLWDTDSKLNTKTGIPTMAILNKLVEICRTVIPGPEMSNMSLQNKILMTMHLLKSNRSFADIMIDFQLSYKSVKLYFSETVQLLSEVMRDLIYIQSREENMRSLPKCFKHFKNVITILDCTESKIATFRCLKCRTSSYSHYKSAHTFKFLIGVSPSGMVNYISPVVAGRSSDKSIFNLTDLLQKLIPGDGIMVDKGFMIANELSNAGIEMIRPEFLVNTFSKEDVQRNTEIAAARVHVERRIARIKSFKVLAEKAHHSLLPYIDDIIRVICALSNLCAPILNDDKFL